MANRYAPAPPILQHHSMPKCFAYITSLIWILLISHLGFANASDDSNLRAQDLLPNIQDSDHSENDFCLDKFRWSGRIEKPTHLNLQKPMCLFINRDFEEAFSLFESAISTFRAEENWENYVWTNNFMANYWILGQKDDNEKAKPYLDNAIEAGTKYLPADHPYIATTYFLRGEYFHDHWNLQKALEFFNKALEIRRSLFGEMHPAVAHVYYALGYFHQEVRMDFATAEEYFRLTMFIRENLLDLPYDELIEINLRLADTNLLKGDFDRAWSHAQECLRIIEVRGVEIEHWTPEINAKLGSIYAGKGDFEDAVRYFDMSIQSGLENNADNNFLALQYNDLSEVLMNLGEFEKALESLKKGQETLDETVTALPAKIALLQQLSSISLNLGRVQESINYLNQSLELNIDLNGEKHRSTSDIYNQLGSIYLEINLPDRALVNFQKSIIVSTINFNELDIGINPSDNQIGYQYHLFDRFANKGICYSKKYTEGGRTEYLEKAVENFDYAFDLMDSYMSNHRREGSKLILIEKYHHYYDLSVDALYELYHRTSDPTYLDRAFQYMESSKSKLLMKAMNDMDASSMTNIPDSIQRVRRSLEIDMAFYQSQIDEARQNEDFGTTEMQDLNKRYLDVTSILDSLLDLLSREFPNFMQATQNSWVPSVNDVKQFGKSTESAVLEYYWSERYIYCVAISPSASLFEKFPVDSVLINSLNHYLEELNNGYNLDKAEKGFHIYSKSAHEIYTRVFASIESKLNLNGKRDGYLNLFIIPDGLLQLIPFQSLISQYEPEQKPTYKDLEYLLKKYSIGYSYTFQLLKRSYDNILDVTNPSALAISYSGAVHNSTIDPELSPLRYAGLEIENIQRFMDGIFLEGSNSTEENFKVHAKNHDIIHLAVHGVITPDQPYGSMLVFTDSDSNQEDGLLHAFELYDLDLKASLVVLSACTSGIGKYYKGEGLYSMARGFLYANSPSVLMTLWPIRDKSTSLLMSNFYEQLSSGHNTNDALRLAQMKFLSEQAEALAHPSNWASFILLGNNPRFVQPNWLPHIVAFSLVIIVTAAFLFLRKKI